MVTTPVLSQSHFRWRTDADTVDATPTWGAAEDTNWTQPADTNFRVRFTVQETAGGNPAAATVKLQANLQGGGFFDVTTSSTIVKAVDASSSTEDTSIVTQRLSGTGGYIAGRYSEDGSPASTVNLGATDNTEWEFGIQIVSADVAHGNTITLKVVALSGTAITATVVPSLTVQQVSTGTGTLAAQSSAMAGAGTSSSTGTGVLAAQSSAISGAGDVTGGAITGDGVLLSQSSTAAGLGVSSSTGAGALAVQASALAGVGESAWVGTGVLLSQASAAAGVGISSSTGTGTLIAGASALLGAGEVIGSVVTRVIRAALVRIGRLMNRG